MLPLWKSDATVREKSSIYEGMTTFRIDLSSGVT